MKLGKLAGFGLIAAASVVMSTSAIANHKSECAKNVKCYSIPNIQNYLMVPKQACDKLGGTTKKPAATTTNNNMGNMNMNNTNAATPNAGPASTQMPDNSNTSTQMTPNSTTNQNQ